LGTFYKNTRVYQLHAKERRTAMLTTFGKKTVLVVDDNEAIRTFISSLIRALGFKVVEAQNGQEGLVLWHEHRHDIRLIVTDYKMPIVDGQQMLAQIKQFDPKVKSMMISGESYEILTNFKEPTVILAKPFNLADLAKKLHFMIDMTDYEEIGTAIVA
jgi:two-component system cell cycle sensor histidine kinase/response regulator CckA